MKYFYLGVLHLRFIGPAICSRCVRPLPLPVLRPAQEQAVDAAADVAEVGFVTGL